MAYGFEEKDKLGAGCLLDRNSGQPRLREQLGRVRPAPAAQSEGQQAAAPIPLAQLAVGTIKSIIGRTVTVAPDGGLSVTVLVPDTTRIVGVGRRERRRGARRVGPDRRERHDADDVLADLRVNDRIAVRGAISDDGTAVVASMVVAMKRAAVKVDAEVHADPQLLVDWQKRGVHGVVSVVDAAKGIVRISTAGASGAQAIAIHTTKETIVRRYAPGSWKIDDAKPGAFSQIMPGDACKRAARAALDGRDITADEIISGPATQ